MHASRLSLSLKLTIAFGIVSFITLIQAIVVWSNINILEKNLGRISSKLVPQNERISALQVFIIRASLETRHAMLMRTAAKRDATLQEIGRLKAESDRITEEFGKNISSEEGRRRFTVLQQTKEGFWTVALKVVPLIQEGKIDAAVDMLESSIIPARNVFLAAIASQSEWQASLLNQVTEDEKALARFTKSIVIWVSLVTVAIGVLIALLFSRYLMRQLGGEPQDAVAAVQAVAQGDLTKAVVLRLGDRASVMAAVADMRERLTQLIREVRNGVDSVATASSEIAFGNADLSHRTEQQASGVQLAAASMQQLTESTHTNAENASQANRVATLASEAAKSGSAAMSDVVSTMDEIEASSSRIGDIVSTIDGIAFQTNILALNAAVEAARAGESGRGFAVVASEVRALAQRSATAAREVKTLISASNASVEAGNRQVTNAGNHMNEILARVGEVQTLIAEIHNASTAQAQRIDTVGTSVAQIDQMTQQNAALVEQSAAAADSLKQQSAQLARAANAFRIGTGVALATY